MRHPKNYQNPWKWKQTNRFNIYRASRSLTKTGFERGSKKSSFLVSIFASILGSILGSILDQKSHIFRLFFNMNFKLRFLCNHASFFAISWCPRYPIIAFLLQKNSYFQGSACIGKVIDIISELHDFCWFFVTFLNLFSHVSGVVFSTYF